MGKEIKAQYKIMEKDILQYIYIYIYLYNGGPKSSDLIGSQLLYNGRIHNCYDARYFCKSLHITPRLEVETVTK